MILKILLVIAVIATVYFLFIKKKPLQNQNNDNEKKPKSNDLVQCSTCGTYAELGESILSNNKYYCSNECLEKA
jgi:uncharacterized protein